MSKTQSFENVNKINRPLAQLWKRKKGRTHINEQGNITIDDKMIENIIKRYLKNQYSLKLENLKEIDEFLDSAKLPKL